MAEDKALKMKIIAIIKATLIMLEVQRVVGATPQEVVLQVLTTILIPTITEDITTVEATTRVHSTIHIQVVVEGVTNNKIKLKP